MKKNQFNSKPDVLFSLMTKDASEFLVGVQEEDDVYIIEGKVPGINPEDIMLDLEQGQLTIGILPSVPVADLETDFSQSPSCGLYIERSIALPNTMDEGAEAKLGNGEFVVIVPKARAESKSATKEDVVVLS